MRYIKGTIDYGVKFQKCKNFKLYGFSDSDWTGSVDDWVRSIDDIKSTLGYCFSLGSGIFFMVFHKARYCCTIYCRG